MADRVRRLGRVLAAAIVATAAGIVPAAGPAGAAHSFTISEGVYRIPFDDGIAVAVFADHHDHSPLDRIDMGAGTGQPVVAAASGIIRAVVDFNGNSPGAGDGVDKLGNPQNDALEHSCQDGTPAVPN